MGYFALQYCTGNNNTGLGVCAGDNITNGTNNTCIGFSGAMMVPTVSNEITLGDTNVTKFRIPGVELHLVITHLLQMVMYLLTVVLLEVKLAQSVVVSLVRRVQMVKFSTIMVVLH